MAKGPGLAILVVLSLLVVAGSGSAAAVERPSWTPGDFWTYRTNITVIPGLNLAGSATSEVTGTYPTGTGGGTVNAIRTVLSGSGTAGGNVTTSNGTIIITGQWTLTGETRLEPRDLHPVYSLIDLSVNGSYHFAAPFPVPLPFALRLQNTTTYAILSDSWNYPLVVGSSGNLTAAYNFTEDLYRPLANPLHLNGTGRSTFAFSVSAAVSLATGAGTFEAYPVREDNPDGSWQRAYYSPAVGNDVRTESYDRVGNLTSVDALVAYRYQAAEPATFLGLTSEGWAILVAAAGAGGMGVGLLIRRRRRKKASVPQFGEEADGPTSGPRGP